MLDDGYELVVSKRYRWHESHKSCENFVGKLNLANAGLLNRSLEALRNPLDPEEHKKYHPHGQEGGPGQDGIGKEGLTGASGQARQPEHGPRPGARNRGDTEEEALRQLK